MKGLIIVGGIAFFIIICIMGYAGVQTNLNNRLQEVQGGKSKYSAALEVCTQKIKGVWAIADQTMNKESEVYKEVAKARGGYMAGQDAWAAAEQDDDMEAMTQAAGTMVQAAMAFRIQVEAYPDWKSAGVQKDNMRNLAEATNEIKTALDDWITMIRDYNKYRGSFWVDIFASAKYPSEIKYFEGSVTKLDVDSLNPQNSGK